jgi:glycosyltransferase involved in cell wall biosynthesis
MNIQNNDNIETPMVSVLVITYNQEKYISETLESIINQEHSYSIEIIIGDDCSTDNTREIIQKYKKNYPSIIKIIFNKTNLGLIKNYYNIVSKCKGKYFMVCAGDDYWLPGKIKNQVDFLENNPSIGMCYGKACLYNDKYKRFSKGTFGSNTDFLTQLLKGNNIPAPSIALRKHILDNYIKEINPVDQNWIMEDSPMWFWFLKNTQIHFSDINFCVYRIVNKSISHPKQYNKQIEYEKNCLSIRMFYIDYYKIDEKTKNEVLIFFNKIFIDLAFKYSNYDDFIALSINKLSGIKRMLKVKMFFYISSYSSIFISCIIQLLKRFKNWRIKSI